MSGDGTEPLAPTLEDFMREALDNSYGWVTLDALLYKVPKELRDADAAEKIVWRWAETGKARLNVGGGTIRIVRVDPAAALPLLPTAAPVAAPSPVRPPTPVPDAQSPTEARRAAAQGLRRSPEVSPAKPITPNEEGIMPGKRRSSEEIHELVTSALKAGPLKRPEIGAKTGLSDSVVGRALEGMKGKIKREGAGRGTKYALANGAKGATPDFTKPEVRARAARLVRAAATQPSSQKPPTALRGVDDLTLKLLTLDGHIQAHKQAGRTISAYILSEIRADLERLAA